MQTWHDFLESLATRGGNLFLLVLFVAVLGFLVFHTLHHPEVNGEVKTVILTTFSGFTGALLGALRGALPRNTNHTDQRDIATAPGPDAT